MNTIAYVLILVGVIVIRSVTRGRSITEIPDDMGDLFVAAVSANSEGVKEVLARRETAVVAPSGEVAAHTPDGVKTDSGDSHNQAQLIGLGLTLKARGYKVGQGPAPFGPIGKHAPDSYHYKGKALDINWSNASEEPAMLDALAKELKAGKWDYKWRESGHYDHLHVDTQSPR